MPNATLNTHDASPMISLFYAGFSTWHVASCCQFCAYVSVLPSISPQTVKKLYRKELSNLEDV
jgi:hypothetical protein